MNIQVLEAVGVSNRYAVIKTCASFDEAVAYVEGLNPICFEKDADYPNCADAFLRDGRILAIQPEGFKA